jgi:hypothetical protein
MKLSKVLLLIVLTFGTLSLSNCNKGTVSNPKACFTVSPNQILAGEKVTFTNCSSNSISTLWEFGDGTTSDQKNTSHIYTSGGTYEVKLTVKNADGVYTSMVSSVTIKSIPPIKMTINQISLTKWPETDFGGNWDDNSMGPESVRPDIFPIISTSTNILLSSSNFYEDAKMGSPLIFDKLSGFPIVLNDMNEEIYVNWYDHEDLIGQNELMGIVSFIPVNIHITNESNITIVEGEWKFTMNVTWVY